ncbi:hypothetical protein C4K19_2324 [Pseudomonas chlororaphis subsp. aurantiaca]|uniref:DUF6602 domain-containing protein n=1 Tax=Pseudomonas chlororaphis subsp. aurantiaca TaxID=86192 RepID=A0AAJ1EBI8_9PSED|nr:DUF6602 domain-containing protein [Pseudomonas chlororaphis]AZD54111.1 hypothetical protein C4K19_2324 [Pseudomonas chlororaphis subsp. aurantiaca]MBU4636966.1 hypothetical protein [Pseudomonas chlororaphis subsp. aurantiaca]
MSQTHTSTNPWTAYVTARMAALIVESKSINEAFEHNTLRGSARELFVKQFLRPFLPPQIGIGTGEIINHHGERSRQVDVVLYSIDRVPPVLVNGSDTGVFPWECVIAVIEVKSRLTAQIWEDAHLNAYSVDQIYQNLSERDLLVGGKKPNENKLSTTPIPYYLFAFDSDLKASTELKEILDGRHQHELGQEGARLFSSFASLAEKARERDEILELIKTDPPGTPEQRKRLKELPHKDFHPSSSNVLGVCVAGKEWTNGSIDFTDFHDERYAVPDYRILSNWNFHWCTSLSKDKFEDVLHFLARLIELSSEMPKCTRHYSIARYLVEPKAT